MLLFGNKKLLLFSCCKLFCVIISLLCLCHFREREKSDLPIPVNVSVFFLLFSTSHLRYEILNVHSHRSWTELHLSCVINLLTSIQVSLSIVKDLCWIQKFLFLNQEPVVNNFSIFPFLSLKVYLKILKLLGL